MIAVFERATVTAAAARRLVGLVTGAWATFDKIAAASAADLRKGPRRSGRDRDELIKHVIGAETAYARKLGVRLRQSAIDDVAAIEELTSQKNRSLFLRSWEFRAAGFSEVEIIRRLANPRSSNPHVERWRRFAVASESSLSG